MKPLTFTLQTPLAILPLYYALQEAGLACTVTQPTSESLHCQPLDVRRGKHPTLHGLYLTEMEQSIRIEAFVRGWLACLNQKPLDPDKPLTVSRVPKSNNCKPVDPWDSETHSA